MKKALCILSILSCLPSVALGVCKSPSIDNSFLNSYKSENTVWKIHDTYFFDDTKYGLSINFETRDITVDLFIYDLGITKIDEQMVEEELRRSVQQMLDYLAKQDPNVVNSRPRLLTKEYFSEKEKNLVKNAVFVFSTSEKYRDLGFVSIVSMGFDGKCFQKIRFTHGFPLGATPEDSFEKLLEHEDVEFAIVAFIWFVIGLNKELLDSGYYVQ
jgi:hypothetical protein